MKKTTLAIAVPALLAAGAASASINLYDADGVTVDISGAAEIQYIQKYNPRAANAAGDDAYMRIDDGDLLITGAMAVTNDLSAVIGTGFAYESDGDDEGTTVVDELWVGFDSNFGRLTFGRQLLLADDLGNAHDYELGTEQVNFVQAQSNQVVKWLFDNGTFYAGFDYALDSDTSAADGRSIVDARVGVRFEGLDARLYAFDGENINTNTFSSTIDQDVTGFNLEVDYAMGAFDVAASYGQVEHSQSTNTNNKVDVDYFQVSGGFQANEKTYFAVGYDLQDASKANASTFIAEESSSIYANVTYSLHSNAKVYAEVGTADVKKDGVDQDTDTGYVLGMEVKF